MPACVLECAQLTVVAAHDQHRQRPDAVLVKVTRASDMIE
jgi:hypothetical protein